jgi:hypothetical protein
MAKMIRRKQKGDGKKTKKVLIIAVKPLKSLTFLAFSCRLHATGRDVFPVCFDGQEAMERFFIARAVLRPFPGEKRKFTGYG